MIPIIDMHCDTISEIHNSRLKNMPVELDSNHFSIDLEKMKSAGYLCQNFALFTYMLPWLKQSDSELSQIMVETYESPTDYALALSDVFDLEMEKHKDKIRPILKVEDILWNQKNGYLSAMKTIEEGAIYGGNIDCLMRFYDLGVRMTTLVWNFKNDLGYPNDIDWTTGNVKPDLIHGLTPCGKEFVEACFGLGILVDISHLNDMGIHDVFEISNGKVPIVASHSNARTITRHPRNLTDDMLRKLADCGGLAGINFCSAFMNDRGDEMTTMDDMIRHIRHMENVAGIETIGLGSDFDGIANATELLDCSGMQRLVDALEKAGYSMDAIEKIFYKNVLRVYREIL